MLYINKSKKSYKHLSLEEREVLYHLFFKQRKSINQIAKELNRNKSTISRELKRNTIHGKYSSQSATQRYKHRRNYRHFFIFEDLKYKSFNGLFLEKFNAKWHGVEATRHYIKINYPLVKCPSVKQIYNWINSRNWVIKRCDKLRTKYIKGRKRKKGILVVFDGKYVLPIWSRPDYINERLEFGHWELDLVIGKRQKGYDNLLTMVERQTRMTFIVKVKSKHPHAINAAIKKLVEKNNLVVKSMTVDNGIEFSKIGIAAYWLNCKAYYCEPFASYQRGSNENVNGLIRRVYKKGFDFTELTDNQVNNLQNTINNIPRKMFNFLSSYDQYQKVINF